MLFRSGMFAAGKTMVRDAEELRVKETDRIAAVVEEFRTLGAMITPTADGFVVEGGAPLQGGAVKSHGDHRIAMSLCVAALMTKAPVTLQNSECVAISYPAFFETLRVLGQEI